MKITSWIPRLERHVGIPKSRSVLPELEKWANSDKAGDIIPEHDIVRAVIMHCQIKFSINFASYPALGIFAVAYPHCSVSFHSANRKIVTNVSVVVENNSGSTLV